MDAQLITVPFHGANLTLIDHSGVPYVAMKPVVEAMGMDWASQFTKIKARFDSTIVEIATVAEDGKQRPMTCLPLRKLPGWLMSIHSNKVRAEIRETVVAYQNECDDALWDYWTKGQATNPRTEPEAAPQLNSESEDEQRTKLALAALHGGKFMTYFGDNGVTVMMPVKRTAFVVEPEEIAGILKEPGSVPLRLLPEIITACAERIGNANRLAG